MHMHLMIKSPLYLKYYKVYKATNLCHIFKRCKRDKPNKIKPIKVDRNKMLTVITEEDIESSDEENRNI